MDRDLVLLHPPSIFDFRKRPLFPGPIAYTVAESTDQFLTPPIGVLSIAEFLDRRGYRVSVDNLGERMARDSGFDPESYIAGTRARVYGVDLHWCVHAQGAIEVARMCKNTHPDSLVVLGGLTATKFHDEIILKCGFVDAVIRGEAEDPFLMLFSSLDKHGGLNSVPNLTYREQGGRVRQEPLIKPRENIDDFEFTRLDLLEPKGAALSGSASPHWSLPVCRGCTYDCATCGGSAYSYRTYLGRERHGFRSPGRIAEDLEKLSEQGVRLVFLFQDPRMGGSKYLADFVSTLRSASARLDSLTIELFQPADQDYVRELSRLGVHITLTMSPESGCDATRTLHGRGYSSEALLKTVANCRASGMDLMVFFMLCLASETRETMLETWKLWDRLYCDESQQKEEPSTIHSFGSMILLDPGSRAFDFPEKNGYRLVSKTLEDLVRARELPSWHQWISYETDVMDRASMATLMLDSMEKSIEIWEKHGVYERLQAAQERLRRVDAYRWAVEEVDRITREERDEGTRASALKSLRETMDRYEVPKPPETP